MHRVLGRDDPEIVAFARRQLAADGVEIHEGIAISRLARDGNASVVTREKDGMTTTRTGSHLLGAAGRKASVEGLGLDAAVVAHSSKGIQVDTRLRSSNRRIYAIGDVAVVDGLGGFQFTHLAGYHAGIVVRNALFKLPARVDYRALPRVTFTDPEIAHVGLTETRSEEHTSELQSLMRISYA